MEIQISGKMDLTNIPSVAPQRGGSAAGFEVKKGDTLLALRGPPDCALTRRLAVAAAGQGGGAEETEKTITVPGGIKCLRRFL